MFQKSATFCMEHFAWQKNSMQPLLGKRIRVAFPNIRVAFPKIRVAFCKITTASPKILRNATLILLHAKKILRKSGPEEVAF